MRKLSGPLLGAAAIALAMNLASAADPDPKAAREREMLHRAQEALRQSQSDNSALAQQKADAEGKLKDAAGQLESARNASKSAQAALRAQAEKASAAQSELTRQLAEVKQQLASLTTKEQASASQLAAREIELKRTAQDLEDSRTANSRCEAKNLQLYQYSQDMVSRYEHKGVWSALTQKEPVLGIKEVGVENVVQEYREKLDSQKIQPAASH